MVRISVLNDALKNIYNAEKVGKRQASEPGASVDSPPHPSFPSGRRPRSVF